MKDGGKIYGVNVTDSNAFVKRFSNFLKEVEIEIMDRWSQSITVSANEPFFEEIIKNGIKSLDLIHLFVETKSVEPIIALTKKIARERLEANSNISEYVHNINVGRSIVCEIVADTNRLIKEDKLVGIMLVNQMFDAYLYHAVREYTILKDSIILEKNRFIKEMHHDRLTILGQIAASFAHEFRNPLTSIKGFIHLLEEKYEHDFESKLYFNIINDEMRSLEDKVSSFLYLSKTKGLDDDMKVFNVSQVIEQMIEFMYPRFVSENIDVRTSIRKSCYIFGVEEQIKQIVLNILINAVEELAVQDLDRVIEIHLCCSENSIELKIANNGAMIPAHLLENIFEPFITTKDLGTGLGLSVVKQIIEKHDATIQVESNENRTTFIIIWKKVGYR